MASVQITKTSNTGATNLATTVVTQKQSQEILQMMILGAFSSLAFVRSLLPDRAFEEQYIVITDELYSYSDFAEGRIGAARLNSAGKQKRTKVPVVRHGRSKRGDMLLEVLAAAFRLLETGSLTAVHLHVHQDVNRSKIIETYQFSIKYDRHLAAPDVASRAERMSYGGVPLNAEATNTQLSHFFRKMQNLCNRLPELPEHRYVSLSIDGQFGLGSLPPEFEPSTAQRPSLAQAQGYKRETTSVRGLDLGYHAGALDALCLTRPGAVGLLALPTNFAQQRLPSSLDYDDHASETPLANKKYAEHDAGAKTSIPSHSVTPNPFKGASNTNGLAGNEPVQPIVQRSPVRPDVTAKQRVQVSQTPTTSRPLSEMAQIPSEIDKALDAMMQPESFTQGDTQPQSHVYPPSPNDEIVDLSKDAATPAVRRLQKNLSNVGDATNPTLNVHSSTNTRAKELKMSQILSEKRENFHTASNAAQNGCQRYLVEDSEDHTLNQLQDLATQRKCLHRNREEGKSKDRSGSRMSVEPAIAHWHSDSLKAQGFVESTFGVGAAAIAGTDTSTDNKHMCGIFDPLCHVAHHLDTNTLEHANAASQSQPQQQVSMPPPETPRMISRTATPSRSSDLDRPRDSIIRPTPRMTRSQTKASLKRRLQDLGGEGIFSPQGKRPGAFKDPQYRSLQSKTIFLATGIDSSPRG